jgi:hypothetical protein
VSTRAKSSLQKKRRRHKIPSDAIVIIIGSMKCGTSSLYHYLQGHPEICPAIYKEPEFFSENQRYSVQVDNYSDLWSFDNSVHKYALEASVGYTKYPHEQNVPKKIYDYGIRPKFIYIIRNPFDRITSHFNFMQWDTRSTSEILHPHFIHISNYFLQLEQYRNYFPLEDILILDFDVLRENPRLILERIYKFLNLSQGYFPEDFEVKNPTRIGTKFERKLYNLKFGSLKLGPFLSHMPNPFKKLGKNLLQWASPTEKRILTDAEKDSIYKELKEDMANLHRIYGVDVCKWGFDI